MTSFSQNGDIYNVLFFSVEIAACIEESKIPWHRRRPIAESHFLL